MTWLQVTAISSRRASRHRLQTGGRTACIEQVDGLLCSLSVAKPWTTFSNPPLRVRRAAWTARTPKVARGKNGVSASEPVVNAYRLNVDVDARKAQQMADVRRMPAAYRLCWKLTCVSRSAVMFASFSSFVNKESSSSSARAYIGCGHRSQGLCGHPWETVAPTRQYISNPLLVSPILFCLDTDGNLNYQRSANPRTFSLDMARARSPPHPYASPAPPLPRRALLRRKYADESPEIGRVSSGGAEVW